MKNSALSLVVLLCLIVMAQPANAVVLFQTGFETQSSVSHETWAAQEADSDLQIQADPDGWFVYGIGVGGDPDLHAIQVTDNTSQPVGGAYAGNNCLRIVRDSGVSTAPAHSFTRQIGGTVHFEAMILTPSLSDWQGGMWLTDNPSDNQHNSGLYSSSPTVAWTGSGQIKILENDMEPRYLSMTYTPGGWLKWEIDANYDTKTWVLTINGVESETLPFNQTNQNTVSGIVFFATGIGVGTPKVPSSFFIDNVLITPEPATLAILGLGGLLLRRKS